MMGNDLAGTVRWPVSPVATGRAVFRSNTVPWILLNVRGRKFEPVSACSFIRPGNEKLAGDRLNSVGMVLLKGLVAGERGSAWFVLNEGTRGMVNARTRAILCGSYGMHL